MNLTLTYLVALLSAGNALKSNNLTVLVLVTYTGYEPRDGKLCEAAIKLVADEVNSRDDILPEYRLELRLRDESISGFRSVEHIVDFHRDISTINPSPIVVGPLFSDGCRRVASVIHHLNMVAIAIGCSAPSVTANRRLYPNFYRSTMTSELIVNARIVFIEKVGFWRNLAILTRVNGVYDLTLANMTQTAALQRGMKITLFDASDPTEMASTVALLKRSDARIVIFDYNNVVPTVTFLCETYFLGISGQRYVVILQSIAFIDLEVTEPEMMRPGCSKEILKSQLEISFFIGIVVDSKQNYGPTSLGYDLDSFEREFDARTSRSRSPDYMNRHRCHDTFLQAVMALDNAERRLLYQNLTLSDFKTYPKRVMTILNSSVSATDFKSLRVGRSRYSPRLEMDDEPLEISQYTAKNGLRLVYSVSHDDRSDLLVMEAFRIKPHAPVQWLTKNGEPPFDSPQFLKIQLNFPEIASTLILVTVTISLFYQVLLVLFIIKAWFCIDYPTVRLVMLSGGLFLNTHAALIAISPLVTEPKPSPSIVCIFRCILSTYGVSLISGVLIAWSCLPLKRSIRASRTFKIAFRSQKSQEMFIIIFSLIFSAISAVVAFFVIMTSDRNIAVEKFMTFDLENDTWVETTFPTCRYDLYRTLLTMTIGLVPFVALGAFVLLYRATTRAGWVIPETAAVARSITWNLLFLLTTCLVFAGYRLKPVAFDIAAAFSSLVAGLVPLFALNWPAVVERMHTK